MKLDGSSRALIEIHARMGLTFKRFNILFSFFKGDFKAAIQASKEDFKAAGIDKRRIANCHSPKWMMLPLLNLRNTLM